MTAPMNGAEPRVEFGIDIDVTHDLASGTDEEPRSCENRGASFGDGDLR
jgi:hypothetical protein